MSESDPPPPESPTAPRSGPLPDHAPKPILGTGCARAFGLGCGAFLVLLLAGLAAVYWNYGKVVVGSEVLRVREAIASSSVSPEQKAAIEQVLRDYQVEAGNRDLSFSGWNKAAAAFGRSPAFMIIGLHDARANLEKIKGFGPAEVDRARAVIDRLIRGVGEGKVSSEDFTLLIQKTREPSPPDAGNDGARPAEVSVLGAEEIRRFLDGAESFLAEKGVPAGAFTPDLPELLRRDLGASLEAGKR